MKTNYGVNTIEGSIPREILKNEEWQIDLIDTMEQKSRAWFLIECES